MGMGFGGGPMWGAGQQGGWGRPGGGGAQRQQDGAPFAGIPPELQGSVEKLLETEPEHPAPTAVFTRHTEDRRPLSLRLLIRHRWKLALVALLLVGLETLGYQTGPYLTQIGIDSGILKHSMTVVIGCGIIYLVIVGLTVVVERFRVRTTGRFSAYIMNDLRVRIFTHLQRLSLDYYTEELDGVIITRMTNDIEVLQQLLQDSLAQFFIQGLTMVIVTAILFSYNVKLAFITIVIVMPPLTVLSLWFRSASERAYLWVRDGIAAVLGDVAESLAGVRVIASYNRQRNNVIHHRNVVGHYRKANFKTAKVTAFYSSGSDFIGLAGQLSLLLIGGNLVLHHQMKVGVLIAFILYLTSFFQPIQQLVLLYNAYQQGQSAIVKLRGLLQTEPSVNDSTGAYDLPPIHGAITLEDVDFAYKPGELVLEDVNLDIKAGESVAFVGPTGAGKSTIAKLVTRFYDPAAGRVLIDGHDLRQVTLTSLRRQLGVVPQEPFLFTGTMRDNIAFARPDATAEEVYEAIRAVGLEELVDRLPDRIDTPVHERGQSLSSGERQLIALARAFLAGPRVLVLDEATSNLDLKSESRVEAALAVLLEGRTAILVAHRLSTAMQADRIIVVDEGRILESGSHTQLIARGGRYAEMFETWTSHQAVA
jgi:ATP-binding cassette subfamily B protein